MKPIFRIVAVAAFIVAGAVAVLAAGGSQQKSYELSDFDRLEVGWVFNVEVHRGDSWSVEVEVSEEAAQYAEVKVVDGTLVLGVENLPKSLTNLRNWNPKAKARVTMPSLSAVRLSGASKLTATDDFKVEGDFKVKTSGAAAVYRLGIDADRTEVECSGASKLTLTASCKETVLDLSGAARLSAHISTELVRVDASGAAELNLSGIADKAKLGGSGACSLNLSTVKVQNADVALSGAAKCLVDAQSYLGVELKGASSCRYAGNDGLKLDLISISKGASLKKM